MSLISKEHLSLTLQTIKMLLSRKADKSELAEKVDRSELDLKADKTELSLKADKTELVEKADKSELLLKADKTELTEYAHNSIADWNQNDETKLDYVKNRTHYVEQPTTIFTAYFNNLEYDMWNGGYQQEISIESAPELHDGEEYIVNINGNETTMICGHGSLDGNINDNYYSIHIYTTSAKIYAYSQSSVDVTIKTTAKAKTLDEKYIPDTIARIIDIPDPNAIRDFVVFNDISDGCKYKIQMQNGNLVSSLAGTLEDFSYTTSRDGTHTLTAWNETYCGNPSTEMIIPDGVIL